MFFARLHPSLEVPARYGDDRTAPDEVVLALRAWMIWRFQWNGGAFLQCKARAAAFERESRSLQKEVAIRGGLGNLREPTRKALLDWAPRLWAV